MQEVKDGNPGSGEAPTIHSVADIALIDHDGEPRALDVDVGQRLGYEFPVDIRKIIRRHEAELERHGVLATVAKTSGPKGGRTGKEYRLNEAQALYIAAKSDAPLAAGVLHMLIRVFLAWRRGHLMPAQPSDIDLRTNGIARQMNAKVTGMERRLAEMAGIVTDLVVMHDARRAVADYVSVRQMLDEAKALTKGRNSLNRRFGYDLRRRALLDTDRGAPPARKCPHSGVWLYQRDFATRFMRDRGAGLVADHNAAATGQGVIRFPDRRKANGDRRGA